MRARPPRKMSNADELPTYAAATQPAYSPAPPYTEHNTAVDEEEEDYDDDENDYADEYSSDDGGDEFPEGSNDLTKRYNRQREVRTGAVAKGGNSSLQKPSINSRISELSRFAGRIKLTDLAASMSGSGGSGGSRNDRADRATSEQVLDPRTRMILLQLINRGTISAISGVLSTGKEANVYHALSEVPGEGGKDLHRAIKVYKTSILVFKDRDRYVTGEHRFRHGYNKSNNRAMVKVWAEKEMRNLKRLYTAGVPSPEPIALRSHVLVMGFLGDHRGWPAPRLRDAVIEDEARWDTLYLELLGLMRTMYQVCKLVHADLSEYNLLYHNEKLYVIDVSQSVEHDHPRTFEFLRMDIKNVTEFFRRRGVVTVAMKRVFTFITEGDNVPVELLPRGENEDGLEENVWNQTYIPRTLEEVYDYERDAEIVNRGQGEDLVYKELLADGKKPIQGLDSEGSETEEEEDEEEDGKKEDGGKEEGENLSGAELDDDERRFEKGTPRGKKHMDKEEKKVRGFHTV